jgi:hypothetical protein
MKMQSNVDLYVSISHNYIFKKNSHLANDIAKVIWSQLPSFITRFNLKRNRRDQWIPGAGDQSRITCPWYRTQCDHIYVFFLKIRNSVLTTSHFSIVLSFSYLKSTFDKFYDHYDDVKAKIREGDQSPNYCKENNNATCLKCFQPIISAYFSLIVLIFSNVHFHEYPGVFWIKWDFVCCHS